MAPQRTTGRPARLSRDAICNAALELLAGDGARDFSLRALGIHLGVDPTAIYRHFADKDDLLREVGDRGLAPAVKDFRTTSDPRNDIRSLCVRMRATLLKNQVALGLTSSGPTRRPNELRITEIMLSSLGRCGLSQEDAVIAYHALIEYTLGSAALDAPLASPGADRQATYRLWRNDYAHLTGEEYPAARAHARKLYPPSDRVFRAGLDALIRGLTTASS